MLEGRSPSPQRSDRNRILRLGISTSILNRGIAALSPLLVVPIALHYLGSTDYGAWATAASLTAFVSFADFGIGAGLMTRLGALQERPQSIPESRHLIASAYAMTTGLVVLGLLVLGVSVRAVDWAGFLGVHDPATAPGVQAIFLITVAAVLLNVLASLVVRVQYGIGQQGLSNLWQAAGNAASLVTAAAISKLDPGHTWFVAAAVLAPVVVASTNTLTFFLASHRGRELRVGLSQTRLSTVRALLSLGSRFVVVALLLTACVAPDPWIVARTTSLDRVPSYVVPYRIFAVIGAVSVMATMPLWPIHSRALAAGDTGWVRWITRRMTLALTIVVGLLSVLAIATGPIVVRLWLGGRIEVDWLLWAGLAVWCSAQTVTGAAFMVQNGAEILGPQLLGYALTLVCTLPLKWWASDAIGTWTIPWVGSAVYCLFIWPACYIGYRKALRRAASRDLTPEPSV